MRRTLARYEGDSAFNFQAKSDCHILLSHVSMHKQGRETTACRIHTAWSLDANAGTVMEGVDVHKH